MHCHTARGNGCEAIFRLNADGSEQLGPSVSTTMHAVLRNKSEKHTEAMLVSETSVIRLVVYISTFLGGGEWFKHAWTFPRLSFHIFSTYSNFLKIKNTFFSFINYSCHLGRFFLALLRSQTLSDEFIFRARGCFLGRTWAAVYLKCRFRAASVSSCPWKIHAVISLSCSCLGTLQKINPGQRRGDSSRDSSSSLLTMRKLRPYKWEEECVFTLK